MKYSNLYLGLVLPSGGWQSVVGCLWLWGKRLLIYFDNFVENILENIFKIFFMKF